MKRCLPLIYLVMVLLPTFSGCVENHEVVDKKNEFATDTIEALAHYESDQYYPLEAEWRYSNSWGVMERDRGFEKVVLVDLKTKQVMSPVYDRIDEQTYWEAENSNQQVYIAWSDGLCGLISLKGEQITDLVYEHASYCNEEKTLIYVKKENRYGVIDLAGKEVIPIQLYSPPFFQEGIAMVSAIEIENEIETDVTVFSYIDESGNELFSNRHASFWYFSNGLAVVRDTTDKCGYIDRDGNYVIEPQFDFASNFNENGYACASIGNTGLIIDKKGNIKLALNDYRFVQQQNYYLAYSWTSHPKSPLSIVYSHDFKKLFEHDGEVGFYGDYITLKYPQTQYTEVISPGRKPVRVTSSESLQWLGENIFLISGQYHTTIIDNTGRIIKEFKGTSTLHPLTNKLLLYRTNNARYGVYDLDGKEILAPRYTNITWTNGEIFKVEQGYFTGFVNMRGQWVYKQSMLEFLPD